MADGLVYKLLSLTIPLDRNGNPVPDIVIDVNGQKVHADITYEVWCEMVNSNDRSRELYLNTMLAFLMLRVVLKAKAFNNLKLDYRDLLYWARHNVNTKWNFADLPQCTYEVDDEDKVNEDLTVGESLNDSIAVKMSRDDFDRMCRENGILQGLSRIDYIVIRDLFYIGYEDFDAAVNDLWDGDDSYHSRDWYEDLLKKYI